MRQHKKFVWNGYGPKPLWEAIPEEEHDDVAAQVKDEGIHHAYNHMNHYDEGFHPITEFGDNFSYDHMNHYDEGFHPILSPQRSSESDPLALV